MTGYMVEKFLLGSCAKPVGVHFRDINMNTTFIGSYEDFLKSEKRNQLVCGANWEKYVSDRRHPELPNGLYLVCREC